MNYLDVVKKVDVIPAHTTKEYKNFIDTTYAFQTHHGQEIGRIIPFVFQIFKQNFGFLSHYFIFNEEERFLRLNLELNTIEKRNAAFVDISQHLRSENCFESLKGWRNERYVCYYPSHEIYMTMERSFAPLLGIVLYGVHINGFTETEEGLKLWIATRSLSKPTFPGMLDNTIAGGIAYPCTIDETVIKESKEEANLDKEFVEKNVVPTSLVTYLFSNKTPNDFKYDISHNENYIAHYECEYVYDLDFKDVIPSVNDDEVSNFKLMTIPEVKKCLKHGKFKPNCGAVIIDLLLRKGYIQPHDEKDYIEIINKLHRFIPYSTL